MKKLFALFLIGCSPTIPPKNLLVEKCQDEPLINPCTSITKGETLFDLKYPISFGSNGMTLIVNNLKEPKTASFYCTADGLPITFKSPNCYFTSIEINDYANSTEAIFANIVSPSSVTWTKLICRMNDLGTALDDLEVLLR